MAKFLESSLFIDGEAFLPSTGYQVTIHQRMVDHHDFKVSFPTASTETAGGLMDVSMGYIGKKIAIHVTDADGELEFIGMITAIDLVKSNGSNGNVVLSGYSPTIIMEQTVQSNSYDEDTSFDQLISETSQEYPADLISIISGEATSLKLPYTVQYNESDYSFLKRLSVRYGLWFYYNGSELCIGDVGDDTVSGVYGHTIDSFQLGVAMQQQLFGIKSHDWVGNSLLETTSDTFQSGSSHVYMDQVKRESDAVYHKTGNYHFVHTQNEYSGQKGIDDATQIKVLGKAANMIKASGSSELPGLRIGNILTIEGLNFEDHSQTDPYGSYILTEITHSFDHAGHYRNSFVGIPEGTTHPHYSDIFQIPKAEAQRAVVIDNADPNGLGRIKVQFPWQAQMGTKTPWIKINTPYAGGNRGYYFVPEINDEVLVDFEGGNAERPFVQSTGYNDTAKSEVDNTDNNIKAIITRSGHTIQFDDTEGAEKINIFDKEGTIITFDTAEKSLYIQAPENVEIGAKNITLSAEENVSIGAGKNIEMAADTDLNAIAKGNLALQSDGDTTAKSKGATAIEAMTDATLKGQNAIIEGKVGAELNATQTKVTGKAMTEVSGAMLKLN